MKTGSPPLHRGEGAGGEVDKMDTHFPFNPSTVKRGGWGCGNTKMKASDIYAFICQCLLMDDDPAARKEVSSQVTMGKIPWEDFVWTGSSHYVLPALYSAFRRNGILPLLSEELALHLEHIHSLNFQRNLEILDQCREIGTFLNHKGIESVFMKGAGFLLSGIYKDAGDRIMEDIDILIPDKDLQKATEYLSILGYLPEEKGSGEKIYEDHHHLPPLICMGKTAPVEIHRLPVHREYSDMMSAEEMFIERVQSREINCWIPSVSDRQQLIFFHEFRAARGYLSATPSIKGMYDLYLLAKHSPPDPLFLQPGRYRNGYRKFIYITGEFFSNPVRIRCPETSSLVRFRKREVFLLNHPRVDRFWHNYVYSIVWLGGLLIKSVHSKKSWELMLLKMKKLMTG
jgi:hypothetical protein